jgi:diguanylate cyclase (GGDEF)-like protein
MKLTVKKFTFICIIAVILVSFFSFSHFYLSNQNKTASIIFKSIKSDMSEIVYIISKGIKYKKDVYKYRTYVDRMVATNGFIKAIVIQDNKEILLTTNPHYKKIFPNDFNYKDKNASEYKRLLSQKTLENDIKFYIGNTNKNQTLQLLFVIDKEEVQLYIEKKESNFFLYFILIPSIVILFISFGVDYFIIKPLEKLRQYAYYQNEVPKSFLIKELETIRYSMVQTYNRLDNEKKELFLMARTDSLSGLANKNSLNEYLEKLIATSSRHKKEFAFLFLDLDHFKIVNDSLGHNIGDELVKTISSILTKVLRVNDFVARIGGDEFAIIIHEYESLMELTIIIDRVQSELAKTHEIQTNPINITSSIGISFYPKDGKDALSLIKHSDIAMYEAKELGRSRYHFYTKELNERVQRNIKLDKDMRLALANNEYQLFYQPKIDIENGNILGAEALIRWISPKEGIISPDIFIPLAEENGFIKDLGHWVMNEAIKQQKLFKEKDLDISISINVSSKQLADEDFILNFINTLEVNKVSPKMIDIEITEYMFFEQNENNYKVLKELHDYGVSISLDDFGTGYSSLSYIKKFPIDNLKIDKVFMDDYNTESGAIFIDTIVKMGQTLNMKIIAEGVEEKKQIEYLKEIKCDMYQGYYESRPLDVKAFESKYIKKIVN